MSDSKVLRRFGMVDAASGYVPIYFGETTNTPPHGVAGPEYVLLSDHTDAIEKLEAEKRNLRAGLTARAKTLLRLRDVLVQVHDHIEDEGDRVYFGSTNDAEILQDVWHELDGWVWDDILADGKREDIYEVSRKAHARAEAAEAQVADLKAKVERLEGALKQIANETETDHIGDRWLTRAATIARAALEAEDRSNG